MSKLFRQKVETFKRMLVQERLAQCTAKQQLFFAKAFPKGVPAADLESAFDLCERMLAKTKAEQKKCTCEPERCEHLECGSGRCTYQRCTCGAYP